MDTLRKYQLDLAWVISQGYDGASVMSGHCTGVQERLEVFAPHAVYIHCYTHVLNLVLLRPYVFLSTTKSHVIFLKKKRELHPEKQVRELQ